MKRFIFVLLALTMVLAACSQKPAETTETTAASTAPVETTRPAPTETTAPPTVPETSETEPVVEIAFRHPLNGEPMEQAYVARPFAVVLNNYRGAMPLCSVTQADVVCEILAEGGITRCLAVFDSLEGVEHIGSIRSARPYLVDLAQSFGAVFVHHGGSKDGYNEISILDADDLDAMTNAGYAYYRDQNRLDSGYDLEHTSFADGDDLISAAGSMGYNLAYPEGLDTGLEFESKVELKNGQKAEKLEVDFASGKTTDLTYDAKTGLYMAEQYTDGFVDGNTNDQAAFSNVLYITAETYDYSDVHHTIRLHIELTGEGEGYFACGGKMVPIKWSRESQTSPFRFTLEDGSPLKLAQGKTYFAIVPLDGSLDCE